MMDNKDKLIDRIQKLLALSKSPNENEAASAAEKVQALLAEHNLSMSDVEVKGDRRSKGYRIDSSTRTNPYPWRRKLGMAVAKLYFCSYFYTTYNEREVRNGKMVKVVYDTHSFVGERHNVAIARMMFEYLHLTIDRLAKQGALEYPPSERSPYRTAFRSACSIRLCNRIAQRIIDAREGGVKTETGTTLPALANMYEAAQANNQAFMQQQGIDVVPRKSKIAMPHYFGARDGDSAGKTIGLDQQVGGSGSAKRIGNG